ncbi:hypothetical protein JW905_14700, partial [bacterium]|nr:hypothetical protein [candidate division CSSED10-310 bacterium]
LPEERFLYHQSACGTVHAGDPYALRFSFIPTGHGSSFFIFVHDSRSLLSEPASGCIPPPGPEPAGFGFTSTQT